ncbi:MAG: acyltransferase [Chloroflexota bacterium]
MKREIRPLTSLRAIAAALVFFYHFIYLKNPAPAGTVLEAILQNGYIGVTLFFVLSGFLLTLRYQDEIKQGSFQWGDYIRRRVARIYPIYYFILAALVLTGSTINITNITLTQGFFTRLVQTGNISAWSLTVEECFYFLLPFILGYIANYKKLSYSLLVLILWTLAMLALGFELVAWSKASGTIRQAGFMGDNPYMLTRTLFGYIFDFSVGIFAAILYKRRGSFGFKTSTVLSIFAVIGIVICQIMMSVFARDPLAVKLVVYCIAALIGLLIFALTREGTPLARLLSWSPLVYMGRISYALYLVQLTPLVGFMRPWPPLLFYAGANIVSAALYQFIEEPARKLILKRTQAIFQPKLALQDVHQANPSASGK